MTLQKGDIIRIKDDFWYERLKHFRGYSRYQIFDKIYPSGNVRVFGPEKITQDIDRYEFVTSIFRSEFNDC